MKKVGMRKKEEIRRTLSWGPSLSDSRGSVHDPFLC